MTEAVLDASALVAFLRNEPGAEKVAAVLTRSCMSAINLAEAYGKLVAYGKPLEDVAYQVERLQIPIIPFDTGQARIAASLWKTARTVGLSVGDVACLALALQKGVLAVTTERVWLNCDTGVEVVRIR